MENMIKEGKSGFDFSAVSSSSKAVNANRLAIHTMALQFIKLVPQSGSSGGNEEVRIDAIRIKAAKVAARVIHSARYKIFQLCSSCPYKKSFT